MDFLVLTHVLYYNHLEATTQFLRSAKSLTTDLYKLLKYKKNPTVCCPSAIGFVKQYSDNGKTPEPAVCPDTKSHTTQSLGN